ncbi:hypothetical protein ACIQHY_12865 [Streptomyces sp. NPDC092359]|uniref:hypothetical protein n=1 Tax=Streptomyces sp. NPDC092359 TaxID=3366014 RepID=UPI0037F3904E
MLTNRPPFSSSGFILIDISSDALALRATASSFEAVRTRLPSVKDPGRPIDNVTISRQLSALGSLLNELGNELLFRTAEQRRDGHTSPAVVGFAAAIGPACTAASALGVVTHRLSVQHQAEHLGNEAELGDYDWLVMGNALARANEALRETSEGLRASAAALSPSSARVEAARSRSTPSPAPMPLPPPPAALPSQIRRER